MEIKFQENFIVLVRLCLVAVKRFPKNMYFLEMLISEKRKYFHVFGCISKNFPENIFWVWKRRRKTQIQKNTSHNPEKNHQQRQIQSDDRAVDRDLRGDRRIGDRCRLELRVCRRSSD